jgi:hypothetical protein
MAYLRIEAAVSRHRKFLQAGPAASWLWLCGLCYCQEGLTDGFIPFEALEHLGIKGARGLKPKLLAAGLWEEVPGGWRVHDYLDWNRDAETVNRIRVDRRKAGVEGGKASWRSRVAEASASPPAEANQNTLLNPTTTTETATTTATHQTPARLSPIAGHRNEHRTHAECGRVCLPAFLFNEFVRRRGGTDPDAVIRAWAGEVLAAWADRPDEPGEPIAFWRTRYDEQWPAPVARPAKPAIKDWRPASERAVTS